MLTPHVYRVSFAGVSGIRGVAAAASSSSSGGWKPPAPPAFSNPGVRDQSFPASPAPTFEPRMPPQQERKPVRYFSPLIPRPHAPQAAKAFGLRASGGSSGGGDGSQSESGGTPSSVGAPVMGEAEEAAELRKQQQK